MRSAIAIVSSFTAAGAFMLALMGCSPSAEPVRDARDALGTVVSVTAYTARATSGDEGDVSAAIEAAYAEMAGVERVLDAHDPSSAIARIGEDGSQALPEEVLAIIAVVERLEVSDEFSPYLFDVAALYDFEGAGRVPQPAEIAQALTSRRLDLGGAAKGLALDRAAEALRGSSAVDAALITAGSTTIAFGAKPDGEPWRIGVEHPRIADETIATVEADGTAEGAVAVTVSTSGDYQRFFERDGIRYHHILDPATGTPARGLRSLTVVGKIPGIDSDILSTALFVMGPDRAAQFARDRNLGLVLVDDQGRTRIVPAPADATWRIVEKRP